jgi:hypothetical protein
MEAYMRNMRALDQLMREALQTGTGQRPAAQRPDAALSSLMLNKEGQGDIDAMLRSIDLAAGAYRRLLRLLC